MTSSCQRVLHWRSKSVETTRPSELIVFPRQGRKPPRTSLRSTSLPFCAKEKTDATILTFLLNTSMVALTCRVDFIHEIDEETTAFSRLSSSVGVIDLVVANITCRVACIWPERTEVRGESGRAEDNFYLVNRATKNGLGMVQKLRDDKLGQKLLVEWIKEFRLSVRRETAVKAAKNEH